jgi:hypothetical protein
MVYSEPTLQSLRAALRDHLPLQPQISSFPLFQSNYTTSRGSELFSCTRCQHPLQQTDFQNRHIKYCNCLAAIFSPPYETITHTQWQDWGTQREHAAARLPDTLDLANAQTQAAINHYPTDPAQCWCPFCQEPDQPANTLYRWKAATEPDSSPTQLNAPNPGKPQQQLICSYSICDDCHMVFSTGDTTLKKKLLEQVKLNLLNKYPTLKTKLPPDLQLEFGAPSPAELHPSSPFISKQTKAITHQSLETLYNNLLNKTTTPRSQTRHRNTRPPRR